MSKRKSTTLSDNNVDRLGQQQQQSASKSNRSIASFQLVKCDDCHVEVMRKDITKHSNICKQLESSTIKSLDQEWHSNVADLFEVPFVFNRTTLYAPMVVAFNKGLHCDASCLAT